MNPTTTLDTRDIIAELGVVNPVDVDHEIERRVAFLCDYLTNARARCYVLGISGGVDSLLAGRLAQLAVERARAAGHPATFYAMRLPYGTQADEAAAQASLDFIRPDRRLIVDIKPATDAMRASLEAGGLVYRDEAHADFVTGNTKARQRMIAQYAVAGAQEGLVIGTDQAAEALMGFFTKFGDGAADVIPLSGLSKRAVRSLARKLGAPEELVMKVPTADLETNSPQKPDEAAFGLTYEQIDDFLEGKLVDAAASEKLKGVYRSTAHKRALPVAP
ncbi:ammonia-dependent NAD(+) synthetase [Pigmentiphaga litoralis]|uniref:ammonia-dependent NAD(+) synthetase n=1 Tax=Pigmentiphaga litoralis TaxID=516702 RepID=UPI003B4339F4